MRFRSYKYLRRASLLVFLVSILLFVASEVVTVAARRVQVRNTDGEIIGEAWIPHDYGTSQLLSLAVMILSGIQLWSVIIIRNIDEK
jgi:hypothetical protein